MRKNTINDIPWNYGINTIILYHGMWNTLWYRYHNILWLSYGVITIILLVFNIIENTMTNEGQCITLVFYTIKNTKAFASCIPYGSKLHHSAWWALGHGQSHWKKAPPPRPGGGTWQWQSTQQRVQTLFKKCETSPAIRMARLKASS